MIFTTLVHVAGRCADGRTFAAGEGCTSEIDDGDPAMVALVKEWAASGAVKIHPAEEVKKAVVAPEDHHDVKAPTRRGHSKEDSK